APTARRGSPRTTASSACNHAGCSASNTTGGSTHCWYCTATASPRAGTWSSTRGCARAIRRSSPASCTATSAASATTPRYWWWLMAEAADSQAQLLAQRHQLQALQEELDETNRGVVALYAELDDKAAQLNEALELKSRFLSYMSHEFRTPLSAVSSMS